MARPRGGYFTKGGVRVPSVTTILSRFKHADPLIHWAWRMGSEGKDYREERDTAADAGTLAHSAVEAHIHSQEFVWPEDSDISRKAQSALRAFLEWADQTQLKITHTEVSLVSEKHLFGGTLDAMLIRSRRSLGDWKSSNGIYQEYLCQLAAYGILWDEHFPNDPVDGGFHLVRFDKTYADFHHHFWAELETAKKAFLLMRELYSLDGELKARAK